MAIVVRRGTAAAWATSGRVLLEGEPGYATDTDEFKVGNGTDVWADLPDLSGGGGAGDGAPGALLIANNLSDLNNAGTARTNIGLGSVNNVSAASLRDRSTHTGTQSADSLTDGTTNKAFLATERTKLSGVATAATANSSDATLLARANHTGSQTASTISDFATAADARIAAAVGSTVQPLDSDLTAFAAKTAPTGAVVGTTDTQTLTNKRVTKRVDSTASTATYTFDWDSFDAAKITAQAAALTLANPTGTPTGMQPVIIRIKDNGTARAISYGTQFRAIGVTLPTTTVLSKTLYLGGMWNSDDSKVDIIAVGQEA